MGLHRYNQRMSKRRWRLVFAVVMLAISLAALAWSFLPGARIVRRQKIHPTEMQLPTPESFVPPQLEYSIAAFRVISNADRCVLWMEPSS